MGAAEILGQVISDLAAIRKAVKAEANVLAAQEDSVKVIQHRLNALHHHLFPDPDLWQAVAEMMGARERIQRGVRHAHISGRHLAAYLSDLRSCHRRLGGRS